MRFGNFRFPPKAQYERLVAQRVELNYREGREEREAKQGGWSSAPVQIDA
jgi:hypothetical protein